MKFALLLYLASVADNFRSGLGFFQLVFFLVGIASIVAFGICCMSVTDEQFGSKDFNTISRANRLARRGLVVCFYSWVAVTLAIHLMPVRRDVYVMAGGYVALEAVHSNVVQATADSALGSIEKWLDKELQRTDSSKDQKPAAKKGNK